MFPLTARTLPILIHTGTDVAPTLIAPEYIASRVLPHVNEPAWCVDLSLLPANHSLRDHLKPGDGLAVDGTTLLVCCADHIHERGTLTGGSSAFEITLDTIRERTNLIRQNLEHREHVVRQQAEADRAAREQQEKRRAALEQWQREQRARQEAESAQRNLLAARARHDDELGRLGQVRANRDAVAVQYARVQADVNEIKAVLPKAVKIEAIATKGSELAALIAKRQSLTEELSRADERLAEMQIAADARARDVAEAERAVTTATATSRAG